MLFDKLPVEQRAKAASAKNNDDAVEKHDCSLHTWNVGTQQCSLKAAQQTTQHRTPSTISSPRATVSSSSRPSSRSLHISSPSILHIITIHHGDIKSFSQVNALEGTCPARAMDGHILFTDQPSSRTTEPGVARTPITMVLPRIGDNRAVRWQPWHLPPIGSTCCHEDSGHVHFFKVNGVPVVGTDGRAYLQVNCLGMSLQRHA